MPPEDKPTPKEVQINNALPILHVDAINSRRRKDGLIYVSLATATPYLIVEQVRLMIDEASLHNIIDDLCRTTDYFPEKPRTKASGPSKK